MKHILTFYRLVFIDSVIVVTITLFSIFILFKNVFCNTSDFTMSMYIVPIVISILFTLLDVAFTVECITKNRSHNYFGMYEIKKGIRGKVLTDQQVIIVRNLDALSSLVLVSVLMFAVIRFDIVLQNIVSLALLLILSIIHIYVLNVKIRKITKKV